MVAIKEQLDFSANSVHVYPMSEDEGESLKEKLKASQD